MHGAALYEESNEDVPTCSDCHGVHRIPDPRTAEFRLKSPQICARCHADPELMGRYKLTADVYDTYVADFHGTSAAETAEAEWRRVHQQRQAPSEMAVLHLPPGAHKLREVLVAGGLVRSRSEAERLVRQRAVRRDGVVVESGDLVLAIGDTAVISVGPSRFVRVRSAD